MWHAAMELGRWVKYDEGEGEGIRYLFVTFLIANTKADHLTVMDESETNMVLRVIDWW